MLFWLLSLAQAYKIKVRQIPTPLDKYPVSIDKGEILLIGDEQSILEFRKWNPLYKPKTIHFKANDEIYQFSSQQSLQALKLQGALLFDVRPSQITVHHIKNFHRISIITESQFLSAVQESEGTIFELNA